MRGKLKITFLLLIILSVFFSVVFKANAIVRQDNFNRADANPIGGNWTTVAAEAAFKIVSNHAEVSSKGNRNASYWNADAFNNNQYSQATLYNIVNPGLGVAVRISSSSETYYAARYTSPNEIGLIKYVAGAYTLMASDFSTTYLNGALLKLSISGTNLTVNYNGTNVTSLTNVSDSSISAGSVGLHGYDASVSSTAYLDDWEGGSPPNSPSSLGPSNKVDGSWSTSTQPTLSFTQSDANASDTLKYRIQISTSSSFASQSVDYTSALLSQTSTSFTVGQAVASGTYTVGTSSQTLSDGQYYWRVMSTDNYLATSSYTTANSGSVAFGIDTTSPTGTIASSTFGTITTSSIIINRPSTSTITESGSGLYQWQIRRNSSTTLSAVSTSTATTSDTSLTSNTQYTYDVRFIDLAGNTSSYGATSSKYTLTPTPTNLSITPSQTSNALLVDSFNNASSSSSGYYFTNTTNSNNSGWITTNSWTDTSLTCNTLYTYTIKYRNGDSTESATSSLSQTTSACSVSAAVASAGLPISILSPARSVLPTTNPSTSSGQANIPISQYQSISFSNYLYSGLASPDVKNLQQLLSNYPDIYPESLITGYYGNLTKQAVQRFQIKYNITNKSDSAYGYVGPKTRKIFNLLEQINYLKNQLKQILNQIKKSS